MNKPTPSEQRFRESNISSFDNNWYIVVKTREIRHVKPKGLSKLLSLFWRNKHSVDTLYWWSSRKWATSEMTPHPIAIKHDDLPLKGFIRKHQLTNGWSIPKSDLKYLHKGPLADETGHEVLVKSQSLFKNTISIIAQLRPLSWIITFILLLIRFKEEVLALFNWIKNAL